MITKGTNEYKRAQELANNLIAYAGTSKNDRQGWELFSDALYRFCHKIAALNSFAAQVAATVEGTCANGFYAARLSDKQAWILACAAVENGIEL